MYKKTKREAAWDVLYFQNVIAHWFVSKINIVVSKKLPKMPNVLNVIQKIYHKQNDMEKFWWWIFWFHKHLSSKRFEFSGNFLTCPAFFTHFQWSTSSYRLLDAMKPFHLQRSSAHRTRYIHSFHTLYMNALFSFVPASLPLWSPHMMMMNFTHATGWGRISNQKSGCLELRIMVARWPHCSCHAHMAAIHFSSINPCCVHTL